ncbi:MAG TPA: phosphatidate cytidylyltransferase [Xanthomonadaceae bacterium]|nr:phosphatidate cytidylyltransferase [Xanthomonadaceae bacterium]
MSNGLGTRVATAVVLAPLAIALVLWAPTWLFALVAGTAMLIGLWEWTRLARVPLRTGRAAVVAVAAALLSALWWAGYPGALVIAAAVGVAWWLVAMVWLRHFRFAAADTPANRVLKCAAGILIIVAGWAALVHLHGGPLGPWWTLHALALVWVADICAYFAGRAFGRRKLAPNISPGKTWAGVWGAMLGASTLALLGGWLGFGVGGSMLAALVLLAWVSVAVSIVGDLFESLVKRHSQSKDSGSLLPGHGGMFDRIDSVLAAAPVFVTGKLLLGL